MKRYLVKILFDTKVAREEVFEAEDVVPIETLLVIYPHGRNAYEKIFIPFQRIWMCHIEDRIDQDARRKS